MLKNGLYCIIINLSRNHTIKIGSLGRYKFPAGCYIYTGSSQNNLNHRIGRHLHKRKKLHWHIDYLLQYGHITYVNLYTGKKKEECTLNGEIGKIKNALIPVKGFGSSDCSCISHLHFFRNKPDIKMFDFPNKVCTLEFSEGAKYDY